jgi:hypothetical protein
MAQRMDDENVGFLPPASAEDYTLGEIASS